MRVNPSCPPVMTLCPSGEKATLQTTPTCPFNVAASFHCIGCSAWMSRQIRAVPSRLPVINSVPLGDQAADQTGGGSSPTSPIRRNTSYPTTSLVDEVSPARRKESSPIGGGVSTKRRCRSPAKSPCAPVVSREPEKQRPHGHGRKLRDLRKQQGHEQPALQV